MLLGCGGGDKGSTTSTPPPIVSITGSASETFVERGEKFSASVTGASNTAVTWSISPSSGADLGSDGSFFAHSAGTFTVTARSMADASRSASQSILVKPKETITGTDANGNGVRDDVETLINNKGLPADLKTKSLDLAATFQAILASPGDTSTDNQIAAVLVQKIKAVDAASSQPTDDLGRVRSIA